MYTYGVGNLPNGMVGLHSSLGEKMLNRASIKNTMMIRRFHKQNSLQYCGPASLALLLNALNLSCHSKYNMMQNRGRKKEMCSRKENVLVNEDDIVNQTDVREYLIKHTNINHDGLNMKQMGDIAGILGFDRKIYFGCGRNLQDSCQSNVKSRFSTYQDFRDVTINYLLRPFTGVILNYSLSSLGYEGLPGHFSPLAAYDTRSDSFLVMDVWPGTPPAWVRSRLLFKAMSTIDKSTERPRGMLALSCLDSKGCS